MKINLSFIKKMDKNIMLAALAVIGVVIVGVLVYANSSKGFTFKLGFGGISKDAVAQKAVDYINNAGLSSTAATLVEASEESGLVKVKIKIGSSEFDSYATKDGKILFPQAFKMDGEDEKANNDTNKTTSEADVKKSCDSLAKTDKPVLEAFVVSRCPFGLQMQRVMAEAIKEQPALADSLKVMYIGSVSNGKITAMHGDAEAQENLRQICIRDEQPAKYWSYVGCQMKANGQEVACEKSTGVDSAKLSACISDAKRGLAYAQKDFDRAGQFNVSGSPTLIMGDAEISESGFGGRSADAMRNIICCGQKTQSGFCSTKLNTAEAASSFSPTYVGSGSGSGAANCGN